ncbi:hypothetical protein FXV83_22525 [Bradyrhizobium hipponense]|uniref:Uncharacterized protein n=1 Tax=Bradyrhizobium hipponense TaxID=2605638 RepID=A0A5S4YV03_9BRAD|nr:hypothetical protein [Bradyrhizobium hipponense]TYO64159.1 hypothetical protein FXV83_22525 [Bradyrhizobium hipponense]
MIQDLFVRRYPQQIYWGDRPTAEIHQLFVQVAHIVFGDLVEGLQLNADFFKPRTTHLREKQGADVSTTRPPGTRPAANS